VTDQPQPPEEQKEPWELTEPKEGYDVYDYDARRARRGFRVVMAVFLATLVLLGLALWMNSRRPADPITHPPRMPSRYGW